MTAFKSLVFGILILHRPKRNFNFQTSQLSNTFEALIFPEIRILNLLSLNIFSNWWMCRWCNELRLELHSASLHSHKPEWLWERYVSISSSSSYGINIMNCTWKNHRYFQEIFNEISTCKKKKRKKKNHSYIRNYVSALNNKNGVAK